MHQLEWGQWGPPSECSAACGEGVWTKNRTCVNPATSQEPMEETVSEECNGANCQGAGVKHFLKIASNGEPNAPCQEEGVSQWTRHMASAILQ